MYLFRRRYGLTLTDPRLLTATDDVVRLDHELDLAAKGEAARQCLSCEGWGYGETCPCSPDRYLDPLRQLVAEKGDDITEEDMDLAADAASDGAAEHAADDDHADESDDCGRQVASGLFGRRR